jgi:hypothetical protein
MSILTVNTVNRATVASPASLAVAASSGGDSFPNTGTQYVYFKNASGSAITVTEVIQVTIDGVSVTGKTFSIPANSDALVGPYPTTTYNDTNSRMNFTYSSATSLTVAVFQNTTS